MKYIYLPSCLLALVALLGACGSTQAQAPSGSGGSPQSGGAPGAGTPGAGGSSTTAGGGGSGGAGVATGGASGGASSGGTAATTSLGGASGGAPSTGGSAGGPSAGSNSGGTNSGGAAGAAGGAPDATTPVGRHGPLKVTGAQLVDSRGAPVQLKGPSSMWLNWESQKFAEDKQGLGWLRDNWKASIIRAAMGVTTTDTRDKDYLSDPDVASAQVDVIVQNAIDLGMYVIIDWHDHNADQHQAQAIEFFTKMAQKWGAYPNVIYEPFNEPLKQDWATVVKPYHEAVIAAIRAVDPDNVIILGTGNWSQDVDLAANSPVAGQNLMYTLHFYSCTHSTALRAKGESAFGKGLPLFVTEWGATNADGGTVRNPELCLEEAQLWHDWMNSHKISWTAWKFERCVDKTCYFASTATVPTTGGWTDAMLNGHAPFVRDRMKE